MTASNRIRQGKDELRAWARGLRAGLPRAEPGEWTAPLTSWPELGKVGTLLIYLPMPGEPDLSRLELPRLAVTRTPPTPARDLSLHLLTSDTILERHRFGFLQPVATAPELAPEEIDAVLVPGLAFDRFGVRLGHGAGYYDRLLARLRPGIPLIGVTHPELIVDELPVETHDVRMTHLLVPGRLEPLG